LRGGAARLLQRATTRTLDRNVGAVPKLMLRVVGSVAAAWLLWGAVLNGSAHIASAVGHDSIMGAVFGGITLWLGHFGMGVLFFLGLAAALFYFTGILLRRREEKTQ
jgi:hypothetical protein